MDSRTCHNANNEQRRRRTRIWTSQACLALHLTIFVAADAAAQVGASVTADFDRDGHIDLAIGEPGADFGRGAVTIYFGQGASGTLPASLYLTGRVQGDNFGTALAAINYAGRMGNGASQLAVGSPYSSNGRGSVQIFEFSPTRTGSRTRIISQDTPGIIGFSAIDDLFGLALATGDFDGDGYSDLAIGVPGEDLGADADAGLVNVLFGPIYSSFVDDQRDQIWTRDRLGSITKAQAGEQFGYTLATGDFNGDGLADLAVGAPFTGGGTVGEINVIYGGSWRLGNTGALPPRRIDQLGGLFGFALAAGDINNDGYDDLVAGAPHSGYVTTGYVQNAGTAKITFGSRAGLAAAQRLDQSLVAAYTPESGDQFGYSLAVADFNGDGFADVAVGVPGETTDRSIREAGLVHIFYGGPTGVQRARAQGFDQDSPNVPGPSTVRDFFGQALVAGDFNGDGFADLVVAAPYKDVNGIANVGVAITFVGTGEGLSAIGTQLLRPTRLYPNALFGYALR
jgi:hypothetical protein